MLVYPELVFLNEISDAWYFSSSRVRLIGPLLIIMRMLYVAMIQRVYVRDAPTKCANVPKKKNRRSNINILEIISI